MNKNLASILGAAYDSNFFSLGIKHGAELEEKGILVFPDFINTKGLDKIQDEATAVKPKSYQSASEYNVYVLPTDPEYPIESPRNRIMKTTKKCIPNDLIPVDSPLMQLYNASSIQEWFCKIMRVPNLYPYADPLSSVNINYYEKGDALGWHFDNSDFTITLLAKNCKKGGVYEYLTEMRHTDDGKENYPLVEKILNEEIPPKRQTAQTGDLMIFKGNKSLHRVTEVLEGERILVTFNYNLEAGIPLSEQSRKTFFGRIA